MITDGHKFYSDLTELSGDYFESEQEIYDLSDDYTLRCYETDKEPIFQLTPDRIMDMVDDERFTEDGDEWWKMYSMLQKYTEVFNEINKQIPELYYENTRKSFIITKQDLISDL